MDIHFYVHVDCNDSRFREILAKLDHIIQKETKMGQQLDDLTTEVANATTVEQSAIVLIQGLAAQLAAAGTDPVKLQALRDSLASSDAALAAAVSANTPASTPAVAPPTAG